MTVSKSCYTIKKTQLQEWLNGAEVTAASLSKLCPSLDTSKIVFDAMIQFQETTLGNSQSSDALVFEQFDKILRQY